jgi:3-isopropylmalate/(R)-2-methylmalate dehydratase small subunit
MAHDDIDTDQILPARFLTTTGREGLGESLFADWRYDVDGQPIPGFVLNTDAARGCAILVAGNNFGCGSSREHAPWALYEYGFRAVISTRIADIFRSNALKNGLLPVEVEEAAHRCLLDEPGAGVEVDLAARRVRLSGGRAFDFSMDGFSRYCLMNGIDQLGFMLQRQPQIQYFERNRPWQP